METPLPVPEGKVKVVEKDQSRAGPQLFQQLECPCVAGQKEMLSRIDLLPGGLFHKGSGASSEMWPAFEKEEVEGSVLFPAQFFAGGNAGKASSDHDDFWPWCHDGWFRGARDFCFLLSNQKRKTTEAFSTGPSRILLR